MAEENLINKFQTTVQSKGRGAVKIKRSSLGILAVVILVFGMVLGDFYGGAVFYNKALNFSNEVIGKITGFFVSPSEIPNRVMPKPAVQKLQELKIKESTSTGAYAPVTSQEKAVIEVVKVASPSVVSIIITKEVPVYEQGAIEQEVLFGQDFPFKIEIPNFQQKGTKKQAVGGGTGFIVSTDGLVLTNRHVVDDAKAEFTAVTSDGRRYPAKVLAKDPVQDLAILKIEKQKVGESFPVLKLGDSSNIEIGQTVVAIGYALGELSNTVSVGVVSGLRRNIIASGVSSAESLEDVIQSDAAINKGNSGGPLLNLRGEVIGINVAVAEAAQSIGFSIPVNKAKRDIQQVSATGKIVYPLLGVRYILIDPEVKEGEKLTVDEGALVMKGKEANEPAVIPGSAAEKAGLKDGDIILEADGKKINAQNSLASIVQVKKPSDKLRLKVLRGNQELIIDVILGERGNE